MTPEERATQALKPLVHDSSPCDYDSALENVVAAIDEAVAEEREACALIADSQDSAACEYIAERIRARATPAPGGNHDCG